MTRDTASVDPERTPLLTIVSGAEQFLVSRAIRRVAAALTREAADLQRRDVDTSSGAPAEAMADITAALSPSLFAEPALVVVGDLADAPEAVTAHLLTHLSDPPGSVWVVARHSGTKNKRALDLLRSARLPGGVAEIACSEVKRGVPTRRFLEAEARHAKRRLTPDAVDALVQSLGQNIALLVGALEQVMSDHPTGLVDAAAVHSTFGGVAEVSGFQLADAVWERRTQAAIEHLRWGTLTGTLSAPGVTGALASGLRGMVRVSGASRALSDEDVARAAGVPPFKVRALRATAQAWRPADLAQATVALCELDAAAKGGLRDGENLDAVQKLHALEAFILHTTAPRQRSDSH